MPGGEVLAFLALGGLCNYEFEDSIKPDHLIRQQPHVVQYGGTTHELRPAQSSRSPGIKNPAPSNLGGPQQPVDFVHGSVIALPREKGCLDCFQLMHQLRHEQLQCLLERVFTAVGADDLVESEGGRFPVAVTKPMTSGHWPPRPSRQGRSGGGVACG